MRHGRLRAPRAWSVTAPCSFDVLLGYAGLGVIADPLRERCFHSGHLIRSQCGGVVSSDDWFELALQDFIGKRRAGGDVRIGVGRIKLVAAAFAVPCL